MHRSPRSAGIEGIEAAAAGRSPPAAAFENGAIDLTEAEGLADLIELPNQSQRRAALALAEGGCGTDLALAGAAAGAIRAGRAGRSTTDEED